VPRADANRTIGRMKRAPQLLIAIVAFCEACRVEPPSRTRIDAPAPLAPLPSARQLAWHELEFYAFVHFNMDTFTGREWGLGSEDPSTFAPTELDCRQWARVARDAGMRGIILTAKHHDGFCLWPSKLTTHDVEASSWRGGRGDVLRELSDACREFGLKFGVYLSPWDRNQPSYGDSPRYNDYFVGQLREVLTNYGDVFEVWFDGACGEGPNGKRQEYDWERYRATVRELQPNAVMFSDVGPDVRWIGNEQGIAGETCWAMLSPEGFVAGLGAPPNETLNQGEEDGTHWIGGECDVSIRPGWYYHAEQDDQVKSLERLLEIWRGSVGRGANLLLNLPVDRRGLVHENDAARLRELRDALDALFGDDLARNAAASSRSSLRAGCEPARANDGDPSTFWAPAGDATAADLRLEFAQPQLVDHVAAGEAIALGQRVRSFAIWARRGDMEREIARGTTIGRKRIVRFDAIECDALTLRIEDARACPTIASFEAFLAPPSVRIESEERAFLDATTVQLVADQPSCEIRYTLDGSTPTRESKLYEDGVRLTSSAQLVALAFRGERAGLFPARAEFVGWSHATLKPARHFFRAPDPELIVDVYEGGWQSLVDLAQSEPARSTTAKTIDLALRPRDEHFALVFRGNVQVPQNGLYTFSSSSDDGSRVYVAGELVVDNDGLHGEQTRSGSIGLEAGFHEFRVEYFNAAGGLALDVGWRGPGVTTGPIPASALFR